MTWETFQQQVLQLARERGCSDAEVCLQSSSERTVSVVEQAVQGVVQSEQFNLSLRVCYQSRPGMASTQTPENPEQLVQAAMDHAAIQEPDEQLEFLGPQSYPELAVPKDPFAECTLQQRVDLALDLEQKALQQDSRVRKSDMVVLSSRAGKTVLQNTKGLLAQHETVMAETFSSFVIQEGDEVKRGYALRWGEEADQIALCAQEAVERGIHQLGATSLPSKQYQTVLCGEVMASLLQAFSSLWDAQEVEKGRSPWKDSIGNVVAVDAFHLVDDPHFARNPRAFDGEGYPTKPKSIVEEGKLCTHLHTLKTARRAGVEPTGNARRTASGDILVTAFNLRLEPGEQTREQLLETVGAGVWIESIAGLHSGLNPTSGDFSVLATGRLIEEGKLTRPVHRFTIAANFLQLLKQIGGLSSQLYCSQVSAPDVWVGLVQIAGEDESQNENSGDSLADS